jgi:hypothetical protein
MLLASSDAPGIFGWPLMRDGGCYRKKLAQKLSGVHPVAVVRALPRAFDAKGAYRYGAFRRWPVGDLKLEVQHLRWRRA